MPRMSYVKKITNDGATSPKNDAFASAATDKDDTIDSDNNMEASDALLMTTDESNRSAEFIDDSNRSGDVDKSISNESPTEKSHRTTLNDKDVTTTTKNPVMKDGLLRHQQPAAGGEHHSSYSSSSQQQQQYERIAQRLLDKDARAYGSGHGGEKQSFLYALHDIIEVHSSSSSSSSSDENNPIISWLPHGQGFIINNKQSFEQNVLPSFLPNTKYASFTRRLKRWKFVRYVSFHFFMFSFHEHYIIPMCV